MPDSTRWGHVTIRRGSEDYIEHWGRVSYDATALRVEIPTAEAGEWRVYIYGHAALFEIAPATEQECRDRARATDGSE